MTMDERIEAVAKMICHFDGGPTWEHLSPGHRSVDLSQARRIIAAAFPELAGDKPTHWLAPWDLTEGMSRAVVLEAMPFEETSDSNVLFYDWGLLRDFFVQEGGGQ